MIAEMNDYQFKIARIKRSLAHSGSKVRNNSSFRAKCECRARSLIPASQTAGESVEESLRIVVSTNGLKASPVLRGE